MKEKTLVANALALRQLVRLLPTIAQRSLNMATFWAEPRMEGVDLFAVGCLLGHYAHSGRNPLLRLRPINFLGQLKSPLLADALLDEYPQSHYQHFTLHYEERTVEAFGESAAALAFRMKGWDLQQLFFPHGTSYEVRPTLDSLAFRLDSYLRTMPHAPARAVPDSEAAPDLLLRNEVG